MQSLHSVATVIYASIETAMKRKNTPKKDSDLTVKKSRTSISTVNLGNPSLPEFNKYEEMSIVKFKERLNGSDGVKILELFCILCEKYDESSSDNRDIIEEYCRSSTDCSEIFNFFKIKRPANELTVIFKSLLYILLRTAKEESNFYNNIGNSVSNLIIKNHLFQIYYCLGNYEPEVISTALKLLTTIVMHGKFTAKEMANQLNFNMDIFVKLSKFQLQSDSNKASENYADVRINFVHFVLSFLIMGDLKTQEHVLGLSEFASSVFTKITFDSFSIIKTILSTFLENVVKNPHLSKTLKVKFFGFQGVLHNIAKLFNWSDSKMLENQHEKKSNKDLVRDMTYEFLESACCSLKTGINFFDKSFGLSGKSINRTLFNFITRLSSPEKDPLLTKLISNILNVCPDLLQNYFSSSSVTFDPSTPGCWLTNCKFLEEVYNMQPLVPMVMTKYVPVTNTSTYTVQELVKMTLPSFLVNVFGPGVLKASLHSTINSVVAKGLDIILLIFKKLRHALKFLKDSESRTNCEISEKDSVNFSSSIRDAVLNITVDISQLTRLCLESRKESKSINIRLKVIKCIDLFSDVFNDIFERSQYDFTTILSGILQLEFVDKDVSKSIHLYDNAYTIAINLLIRHAHRCLWFKTDSKGKSAFQYLLLIFTKPRRNLDVQKSVFTLTKKILLLNSVYDDVEQIQEFNFWLNNLSYGISDVKSIDFNVNFVTSIVSNVVRQPNKFLDYAAFEDFGDKDSKNKQTSHPCTDKKWWSNIPEVNIVSNDDKNMVTSNNYPELKTMAIVSKITVAALDAMQHTKDINFLDKYLSKVLLDLFHSTQSIENGSIFYKAISTFYKKLATVENWEQLKIVKTFFSACCGKFNVSTLSTSVLKENFNNYLMEWFVNSICSMHDNTASLSNIDTSKILKNLQSSLNNKASASSLCVNQILLYLDICNSYSSENIKYEKNNKLCMYYLSKLLFDIMDGIISFHLLDQLELRCIQSDIFHHEIIKKNFLADSSESFLSEIITPRVINNLCKCEPGPKFYDFFTEKYITCFQVDLLDFVNKHCQDNKYLTIKTFPNFCHRLSVSQMLKILEFIVDIWKNSCQSEIICVLFTDAVTQIIQLLCMNTYNSDYVSFPKPMYVETCLKIVYSSVISKNSKKKVIEILHTMLKTFLPNTGQFISSEFVKWCLTNDDDYQVLPKTLSIISNHNMDICILVKSLLFSENSEIKIPLNKKAMLMPIVINVFKMLLKKNKSSCYTEVKKILKEYTFLLSPENEESICVSDYKSMIYYMVKFMIIIKDNKPLKTFINSLTLESFEEFHVQLWILRIEVFLALENELSVQFANSFAGHLRSCFFSCLKCLTLYLEPSKIDVLAESNIQKICDKVETILLLVVRYKHADELFHGLSDVWNKLCKVSLKYQIKKDYTLNLLNVMINALYEIPNENIIPIKMLRKMIIGHSEFLSILCKGSDVNNKNALIKILLTVTKIAGSSSFDSDDYVFLLSAYQGTLNEADQNLLSILQLYEQNNVQSNNFKPFLWGQPSLEAYNARKNLGETISKKPGPEQILLCLNQDIMKNSLLHFPIKKRLIGLSNYSNDTEKNFVYDPSFLLPTFLGILDLGNYIDCRAFIALNGISYIFMSLSSHCYMVRALAVSCLNLYYHHVESSMLSEKNLILYFLQLIRNGLQIKEESKNVTKKLCVIVTRFLAKMSQLLINPGDHMFSVLYKFLLVKSELDLHNVPEFYVLFCSSNMEYKTERKWILELLGESISDMSDFHLMEKRKICKILFSFYDSSITDNYSNKQILKILNRLCEIKGAVSNLVYSQGLLSWIQNLMYNKYTFVQVKQSKKDCLLELVNILQKVCENTKNKATILSSDALNEIRDTCFIFLNITCITANNMKIEEFVQTEEYLSIQTTTKVLLQILETECTKISSYEMSIIFSLLNILENKEVCLDLCKVSCYWLGNKATRFNSELETYQIVLFVLKNYGEQIIETFKEDIKLFCTWINCWCNKFSGEQNTNRNVLSFVIKKLKYFLQNHKSFDHEKLIFANCFELLEESIVILQ